MSVELYPDQADLVHRVRQSMRQLSKAGVDAECHRQRTRMALDMIAGAYAPGQLGSFLVPHRNLLSPIKTIEEYGFGSL